MMQSVGKIVAGKNKTLIRFIMCTTNLAGGRKPKAMQTREHAVTASETNERLHVFQF